jgi:hypothetical protein
MREHVIFLFWQLWKYDNLLCKSGFECHMLEILWP